MAYIYHVGKSYQSWSRYTRYNLVTKNHAQDLWWKSSCDSTTQWPSTIGTNELRRDYIHLYSNQSVYLMMAGLKNKASTSWTLRVIYSVRVPLNSKKSDKNPTTSLLSQPGLAQMLPRVWCKVRMWSQNPGSKSQGFFNGTKYSTWESCGHRDVNLKTFSFQVDKRFPGEIFTDVKLLRAPGHRSS